MFAAGIISSEMQFSNCWLFNEMHLANLMFLKVSFRLDWHFILEMSMYDVEKCSLLVSISIYLHNLIKQCEELLTMKSIIFPYSNNHKKLEWISIRYSLNVYIASFSSIQSVSLLPKIDYCDMFMDKKGKNNNTFKKDQTHVSLS